MFFFNLERFTIDVTGMDDSGVILCGNDLLFMFTVTQKIPLTIYVNTHYFISPFVPDTTDIRETKMTP